MDFMFEDMPHNIFMADLRTPRQLDNLSKFMLGILLVHRLDESVNRI